MVSLVFFYNLSQREAWAMKSELTFSVFFVKIIRFCVTLIMIRTLLSKKKADFYGRGCWSTGIHAE